MSGRSNFVDFWIIAWYRRNHVVPTEPTEPTGQNEVLIIIVVVAGSVAVAAATAWIVYTQKKRARVTNVGLVNEDAGL